MVDYAIGIKKELLHAIATNEMQCCRQSFLAGILQGACQKPFVKARIRLRKSLLRCLPNMLPTGQSLEIDGSRILLPGLDQLVLRRKFVDRIRITSNSESASASHCLVAFIQAMFIAYGYIQNPDRGYHLEFRLRGKWLIAAFKKITARLRLRFCVYRHEQHQSFYMKSGRRITRLLNLLGLFDRGLEFADLRATRSLLSMVNRQVNSETANINRLIGAAESSINHISELLAHENQEIWTESLHRLAQMRLKFPHDSIEALGRRFEPPLSKSAVNHRLRRIKALHTKIFGLTGPEDQAE
ncbi:MAG TPA: DNA-binding protein WhiA [Candidatus Rifleibacterium sp.]|nr:DNA-binding protein WhiA [Candidatus Rifleibacterium sp.]HPT46674.1 DNA-binding protein WhiA [Candidatus Rifleibacterium sp.]